jgi:tRNA-binding protein
MTDDTPGSDQQAVVPPFQEPGSATIDDFLKIDMRVGRIVAVDAFPAARKPAYRLTIDFGPGGMKRSSAQLPATYPDRESLVGRLVVAVVNFGPRNIAGFQSEVLVLGAAPADGRIPLLGVDQGASPGDAIR